MNINAELVVHRDEVRVVHLTGFPNMPAGGVVMNWDTYCSLKQQIIDAGHSVTFTETQRPPTQSELEAVISVALTMADMTEEKGVEEVSDVGWPNGECPTCGVADDHTMDDCMKNLHRDDPPDAPGCCSTMQPCGDGCNCPPEWKE
jgi:hypothetical protein